MVLIYQSLRVPTNQFTKTNELFLSNKQSAICITTQSIQSFYFVDITNLHLYHLSLQKSKKSSIKPFHLNSQLQNYKYNPLLKQR